MGQDIGIYLYIYIYIFNSDLEFYCYRIIINPFLFKYLLSLYFLLNFYLIFIIKINASSSNDSVRRLSDSPQ